MYTSQNYTFLDYEAREIVGSITEFRRLFKFYILPRSLQCGHSLLGHTWTWAQLHGGHAGF